MALTPILPATDEPDSAPFWAATREHRLVVQRCTQCAALRFPPRPMCAACQSTAHAWQQLSGDATIWSFAIVHGPSLPALTPFLPYPVVYAEMDDAPGLRMAGNLVAAPGAPINSVPPERIAIGSRVTVAFAALAEDVVLPRWQLRD